MHPAKGLELQVLIISTAVLLPGNSEINIWAQHDHVLHESGPAKGIIRPEMLHMISGLIEQVVTDRQADVVQRK